MLIRIVKKLRRLLILDHNLDAVRQDVLNLQSTLEQIKEHEESKRKQAEKLFLTFSQVLPNPAKARFLIEQIDLGSSEYSQSKSSLNFEEVEYKLQNLDPKIYPIYKTLFENGKRAYEGQTEGNFSNWDSPHSRLFEKYIFNFISGRVLDIGCGTDFKPIYLSGYPNTLISAIEPLDLKYQPEFEVVKGFCEFLPWNNNSFSTAIAATSLDHVLDLDKSLEEIKRVLLPNGLFLTWIASVSGAKAYNPRDLNFAPEDDFHLFHFNEKWFEPLMKKHCFEIVDKTKIPQPGFDHIFYCFQSKK